MFAVEQLFVECEDLSSTAVLFIPVRMGREGGVLFFSFLSRWMEEGGNGEKSFSPTGWTQKKQLCVVCVCIMCCCCLMQYRNPIRPVYIRIQRFFSPSLSFFFNDRFCCNIIIRCRCARAHPLKGFTSSSSTCLC